MGGALGSAVGPAQSKLYDRTKERLTLVEIERRRR
jgi:hypothetical protein